MNRAKDCAFKRESEQIRWFQGNPGVRICPKKLLVRKAQWK